MIKNLSLRSVDHSKKIYVNSTIPEHAKAVLQIVPGMSDYIDRYQDFADYLAQNQIAVIGHDHIGQGKTAFNSTELGHFGKNGVKTLIEDTLNLSKEIKNELPDLPLFILGHSLGSMIVTEVISQAPEIFQGSILVGVTKPPKTSDVLAGILTPLTLIKYTKFTKKINNLVYKFYNKEYDVNSRLSWVTGDQAKLEDLKQDPLIGYDYSLDSLLAILRLSIKVNEADWIKKIPKEFPIVALSGTLDPAGDYGFALMKLNEEFENANLEHYKTHLCYGMQHELLNDTDRLKIYSIIDEFILLNKEV